MSFKDLQRNREQMFTELTKEVNSSGGRPEADERVWYPAVDAAGNGFAVFRFLPTSQADIDLNKSVPYVREFTHGFRAAGGWYIEKSLTTLGLDDPCGEYNQKAWAAANSNKDLEKRVSARKRTLSYWSNIYIVKDPANPENEGKVRLFRYGKKIMDMIKDKMQPEFADEAKMNPFDLWQGANFTMKIRTEKKTQDNPKGFKNYDKSSFGDESTPLGEDAEMEKIWKQTYSLQALIDPKGFKSYDDLKKSFKRAMGNSFVDFDMEQTGEEPAPLRKPSTPKKSSPEPEQEVLPGEEDDGNDDLDMYKRIAAGRD